jgi:hypothetical protein
MGPPAGHRNHAVFVVALIASGRNAVAAATAVNAGQEPLLCDGEAAHRVSAIEPK